MKLDGAGELFVAHKREFKDRGFIANGVAADASFNRAAWGVEIMMSSTSSGSIGSGPSESLSSESIILMLLTEPEMTERSPFPCECDQPLLPICGESSTMELWPKPERAGIGIAFCVMVGDESGDEASASVEWCRFVHALAKSNPLECLGRTEAGEP